MYNSKKRLPKKIAAIIVSFAVMVAMTPLLGLPADVFAKTHQGGQQSQSEENGNIVSNGTNFGPGGNNFRPGINNNDQNNGDDEIDNDNDFDNDSDIDDNGNDNNQEGELSINEDPESAVYAIGNYAEDLTVGLSGDSSSATFQWYKSDNEDSDGTAISGATDDTLDGEEISTESAGSCYYYCVVEDGDGNTLTSDNAEITVKELAITTQPKSGTYKQGKNVKLSVAFIGNGDVQWYSSTDNSTWEAIEGCDNSKIKVNTKNTGTTYYKAIVTNGLDEEESGFASVESDVAKIVVSEGTSNVIKVGQFKYKVNNDTAVLTGVAKKTYTKLVIPETVEISGTTYNITSVANGAFSGCKKLRYITIGSNVTSIGVSAFNNCHNLKKVTFSGTAITSIGKGAFRGVSRNIKFIIPAAQLTSYQQMIGASGIFSGASFISA